MIIFFGPSGAGKSIQCQILSARKGWRWFSMGQLLRDTRDPEIFKIMQKGELVPISKTNELIDKALKHLDNNKKAILDGYPRCLEQARWLVEEKSSYGDSIDLVVVLEVSRPILLERLRLRGRIDDTSKAIDDRLRIYRDEIEPILNYFTERNINIVHLDGSGTVGQVHDKIMEELSAHNLV